VARSTRSIRALSGTSGKVMLRGESRSTRNLNVWMAASVSLTDVAASSASA
jgi:hypothetical protein